MHQTQEILWAHTHLSIWQHLDWDAWNQNLVLSALPEILFSSLLSDVASDQHKAIWAQTDTQRSVCLRYFLSVTLRKEHFQSTCNRDSCRGLLQMFILLFPPRRESGSLQTSLLPRDFSSAPRELSLSSKDRKHPLKHCQILFCTTKVYFFCELWNLQINVNLLFLTQQHSQWYLLALQPTALLPLCTRKEVQCIQLGTTIVVSPQIWLNTFNVTHFRFKKFSQR